MEIFYELAGVNSPCFYRVCIPNYTTLSSSNVISLFGNYSLQSGGDSRVYVQLKWFTEVELI